MTRTLCPNCREPLSENARFCMECGSRIDFGMTRKELEDNSTEVSRGLRVNENEMASNPFCGTYNSLKDKIINPELSPLPEKKSFTFKSWDEIKTHNAESETEESKIEESRTEGSETEEIIELQEDATDFEALKEVFSETEEAEEPQGENIVSEVLQEQFGESVCEEEIIEQFEKSVCEEEIIEQFEESVCEEEIIEQSIDNVADPFPSIEKKTEVAADNGKDLALAGIREQTVLDEQNSDRDTETFIKDLSEKICNQVNTETIIPERPSCNNKNRVITSTVGGGFKRRASQAEEVKEITSFFGRKRKRE